MTLDHNTQKDASANETAVLLDQIMRGEKILLLPPGAVVASLLMVVLAFGILGFVSMLGAVAVTMGVTTDVLLLEYFGGIALILGPCVGQFLVILGHSQYGRRLLFYVRSLWIGTMLLIVASAIGWLKITCWMGVIALVCLGGAHQMLRSRAYAAMISFFSLSGNTG